MKNNEEKIQKLLENLLIVQLRIGGASQKDIQNIVGVDVNRVSKVIKSLKKIND